jgi:hypothetical protein
VLLLDVEDDDELSDDAAVVVDSEVIDSRSETSCLRSFSSVETALVTLDESDNEAESLALEVAELLVPS